MEEKMEKITDEQLAEICSRNNEGYGWHETDWESRVQNDRILLTCKKCFNKFLLNKCQKCTANGSNGGLFSKIGKYDITCFDCYTEYGSWTCPECGSNRKFRDDKAIKVFKKEGKSGCFIATACYDSPFSPEVLTLREYRDTVLSRSIYGRCFIKIYYVISPTIAKMISENMITKRLIKGLILNKVVHIVNVKLKKNMNY